MKYCFSALLLLSIFTTHGQTANLDSSRIELQPIEVKQYFTKQYILKLTGSANTVSKNILEAQNPTSMTSAINTVAGVRMEERSPGSYRLAMRGSLIRSPFGIRNTKVYIGELPFTDAGGNTYLNLLDPAAIEAIQIIKGPDGSLFGANSGGVIRINPYGYNSTDNISLQTTFGSFGLFQENLGISKTVNDKYSLAFHQSYLTSDGYRENAAFQRKTFQTAQQWNYTPKGSFKLFAIYTDLDYQTPGGLTLQQYIDNPKSARPAAGPNPSAIEQKATIYNKTVYGGLSHEYQISKRLTHFIGVFGSYTDFENPFITNYEFRTEKNLGTRTFLSYENAQAKLPYQFQIGLEALKGWNKIDNFDNNKGVAGSAQAKDQLDNEQLNVFARAQIDLTQKWLLEGSLGLNKNNISYQTFYPEEDASIGNIDFKDVWMPRLATSYSINSIMAFRGSISKGYSTPTLAEVRASDNVINRNLLAESGINYELGYKIKSENQHWLFDIAAYTYNMDNGIIRKLNEAGVEFYNNAGEMKQKGIEAALWTFWDLKSPFLKSIQFSTSTAFNHYRFGEYTVGVNDYKGYKITSVPNWTFSNSLNLHFAKGFQLNIYHNHTSKIPLDDANTVFADSYDLLQARLNWNQALAKWSLGYQIFLGADNILDQRYSLGNDINAFGGRYFNASPSRNLYIGIKFSL